MGPGRRGAGFSNADSSHGDTRAAGALPAEAVPWLGALKSIQLIPAAEQNGAVGSDEALNLLCCSAEVLEELVRAGLPAVRVGGERRYDSRDIFNLAFYSSARRSVPRLTLAAFARLAREVPERLLEERRWSVMVKLSCPAGAECGGGRWTLAIPASASDIRSDHAAADDLPGAGESGGGLVQLADARGTAVLRFRMTTRGKRATLVSPTLRGLYRGVRDGLRFHLVPSGLKADLGAITKAGIADCDGFSELLAARCRAAGYHARVERGLLFVPFGFGHHAWVNIRDDDGEWKTLDPTLPSLARLGGADVTVFGEACGGWLLNRVAVCERSAGGSIAWHACAARRADQPLGIDIRIGRN